jgi:hypothetical protein
MTGIERGFPLFHYQIPAQTYRDYQTTQVLALQEDKVIKDKNGKIRGPVGLFNSRIEMLKDYTTKDRFGFSRIELEFSKIKQNPPYKVA